ncbi:Pseudaminic acid synthase [Candidatus Electronema aureum]
MNEKMQKKITIGNHQIGKCHLPFIIAEMSGNHNRSLDTALKIVEAAAASGVHALKLQTYTADTMTLNLKDKEFIINDPLSLWHGRTLYDLYQEAHTPWEWHEPIFNRAKELGLIAFSTPFDETAVDFLENLNVPCYKISSFENNDIRLIRKVASTRKTIIISTGMATIGEIDEMVQTAREAGAKGIILLKCTSTYPASPEDTNIITIPHMRELFGCEVGLSDHTIGMGVSIGAIALGAAVIEKHFTLCRDGGVDAKFSMDPIEMKLFTQEIKRAWQAIGNIVYGPTKNEINSLPYKRSLYIVEDMKYGEEVNRKNIRAIRPGYGLNTKYFESVLGKRVKKDIKAGTPLSWDII